MDIASILPEDAMTSAYLETYKAEHHALWTEVVRFNATVYILESLAAFPWSLLAPREEDRWFWNLLTVSLFESATLIIWRISGDNDADVLSIRRFKNAVYQNLRSRDYQDAMRARLREVTFADRVSRIESKVKVLRDSYQAHLNRARVLSRTSDDVRREFVYLQELIGYRDTVNDLFDVLCMGHAHAVLPLSYVPNEDGSRRFADIDAALTALASDSGLLRLPENEPDFWELTRQKLRQDQIDQVNLWRARLQLPAV